MSVADTLHTATAVLTINVLDINDNSPLFTSPQGYTFNVSENIPTPPPVSIGTVVANDSDSGINGQVCTFLYTCISLCNVFMLSLFIDILQYKLFTILH